MCSKFVFLLSIFVLFIFPANTLAQNADEECGCESYSWSWYNPFGALGCLSQKCPKNERGTPKCYPFIGHVCKCAGKNPLRRNDATAYSSEEDIESPEGIMANYLEYYLEYELPLELEADAASEDAAKAKE